jgi:hypothetical protein
MMADPKGYRLACVVFGTELFAALHADGYIDAHSGSFKPATSAFIRKTVREYFDAATPPEGAAMGREDAHWAFAAADALRPFVSQLMDVGSTSATDRGHLLWMIERMNPKSMSATKACRWLGWIQCALCDQGVMNLPAAKEHNAKFRAALAATSAREG